MSTRGANGGGASPVVCACPPPSCAPPPSFGSADTANRGGTRSTTSEVDVEVATDRKFSARGKSPTALTALTTVAPAAAVPGPTATSDSDSDSTSTSVS